jgi:hypothetical protein
MTSPGTGVVRLLRSAVLTGLVVALAVLAHRLGGGESPPAFAIVAITVPLWPLALIATRRRLGPLALLGGLGAGQLLGHGVLGWLAASAPSAVSAGSGVSPGFPGSPVSLECVQHAVHQGTGSGCLEGTLAAAWHTHEHAGLGLLMLVAHAVATVLAALLVARGEQVLWRVLDLLVRILPVLLTPVSVRPLPPHVALLTPTGHSLDVPPGRGPPAYAV